MTRLHPASGSAGARLGILQRPIAVPFSPWAALLVLAMAAAWLNPNHFLPWPSFDGELWMAAVLSIAAIAVATRWRVPWPITSVTWFFLALALIALLQMVLGLVHFAGDAWLFALYCSGAALAVMLGSRLQHIDDQAVASLVLGSSVVAAILSVGVQIYQWLTLAVLDDITGLGIWIVVTNSSSRPPGNIAQPNLQATLHIWGLLGLWWLYHSKRIGGRVALPAAAFIAFGIVLAQSRASWLSLIVVAIIAAQFRRVLGMRREWYALAFVGTWVFTLTLLLQPLSDALHLGSTGPSLQERLSAGPRTVTWRVLLEAITMRPLMGYGVGQVAVAQDAAVMLHPASGERFSYAHNVVLDLLIWFGVPLGGAVVVCAVAWLIKVACRVRTAHEVLLFASLCVLGVHAMVEYPHTYAFFLLPAAMTAGALHIQSLGKAARAIEVAREAVAGSTIVMMAILAIVFIDYRAAVSYMDARRFEQARIGPAVTRPPPRLHLLTQLEAFIDFGQIDVRSAVSTEDLELMRKVSERYSGDAIYFRYAMAAALAGNTDAAQRALGRLCRFHPRDGCEQVRVLWHREAIQHPRLRAIEFPVAADLHE